MLKQMRDAERETGMNGMNDETRGVIMGGGALNGRNVRIESGVWAMRLAVAVLIYVLVAAALSPGFLALGSPLHADVYRYFRIAQEPLAWGVLLHPRPLMLVAIGMLDVDDFRTFYGMLLVAPILLPLFLLAALERVRSVRMGWGGVVAYLALCYVLPSFYELAPLDFGGTLSGIVACIAAMVLCGRGSWIAVAGYVLLTWASLEFKPTYAFVLCAFPLLAGVGGGKRRIALVAAAGAFAAAAGVFLKDRWLGSAFVGVGVESGGSYQLLGQPGVVGEALGFYLQRLLSPMGWLLVLACMAWLLYRSHRKEGAAIVALALTALLPMLLIPNHRFVMYAWYSSSILLLLVPLAALHLPHRLHWRAGSAVLLSALVLAACLGESKFLPGHRAWYAYNQRMNANVLVSLDQLQGYVLPGDRVLISGRLAPYVAFKNDALVARYLPKGTEWTVVTPPREEPLIATSNDTRRYRRMADVDGSQFDKHIEYGDDGRIDRVGPPNPALGAGGDTPVRRELLFCTPAIALDASSKPACLAALD